MQTGQSKVGLGLTKTIEKLKQNNIIVLEKYYVYCVVPFYV
jgi:hypothetical protein